MHLDWRGRAGAVVFRTSSRGKFLLAGVHGAHGDDLLNSLNDVSSLFCKGQPKGRRRSFLVTTMWINCHFCILIRGAAHVQTHHIMSVDIVF